MTPISHVAGIDDEKKSQGGEEEEKKEAAEEDDGSNDSKKKPANEGVGHKIYNDFFQPNGSPKPDSWAALFALLVCGGLLVMSSKPNRKEILFMEFLNDHLLKGNIKEIKIKRDRSSEVFNHRAEIDTHDG